MKMQIPIIGRHGRAGDARSDAAHQGSAQTRARTQLPGMALAVLLALLVGQAPVFGKDDKEGKPKLVGTWNVTLMFPECTTACGCPGGVPNIPIPVLQTYLKHGAMLEVGSIFLRSTGLGSWERIREGHFVARHKFFLINPDGSRRGSEEVTIDIRLTGSDAFEGHATFDLFGPDGAPIPGSTGCIINSTATRFE